MSNDDNESPVWHFHEWRPSSGIEYFSQRRQSEVGLTAVSVLVPVYNEEASDLMRTLRSLRVQEDNCQHVEFHILVIFDGMQRMSDTATDLVSRVFGVSADDLVSETLIYDSGVSRVSLEPGLDLRLSLLVKAKNRKKFNSHEWYFRAFASMDLFKYIFCTDCGTVYDPACLQRLVEHMDNRPNTIVVTGRQHVMTALDQDENERITLMGAWFRAVQLYDFAASVSSFQGAFSLVGFLPVIPGPCGLWRAGPDCVRAVDDYFAIVAPSTDDEHGSVGLVAGNMLLAEDRILSFTSVLSTGKASEWVTSAIFYFEAEREPKQFLAQRRRWQSGTFFCYVYILWNARCLIFGSQHGCGAKVMYTFLMCLQAMSFIITAFTPSVFAGIAAKMGQETDDSQLGTAFFGFGVFYMCVYVLFVLRHMCVAFDPTIVHLAIFTSLIMALVVVASVLLMYLADPAPLVLASVSVVTFLPFGLAISHSFDVFIMMVASFLPFFLFLPMFLCFFSAYASARVFDVSWGNRPASGIAGHDERLGTVLAPMISVLAVAGNIGAFVGITLMPMHTMVNVTLALMLPSVFQQILSAAFYLLYTSPHLLTQSVHLCGHTTHRVLAFCCTLVGFAMVTSALLWPDWVHNPLIPVYMAANETHTSTSITKYEDARVCSATEMNIITAFHHLDKCFVKTEAVIVTGDEIGWVLEVLYEDVNGTLLARNEMITCQNSDAVINVDRTSVCCNVSYMFLGHTMTSVSYSASEYDRDTKLTRTYPITRNTAMKFQGEQTFRRVENHTRVSEMLVNARMATLHAGFGLVLMRTNFDAVFRSQVLAYGSNPLYDMPNKVWMIIMFTACVAVFLLLVVLIANVLHPCLGKHARAIDVSTLYTWLALCCVLVCVTLFPFAWRGQQLFQIGWWRHGRERQEAMDICGPHADFFALGECEVGIGYALMVLSVVPLHLAVNFFRMPEQYKKKEKKKKLHINLEITETQDLLQIEHSDEEPDEFCPPTSPPPPPPSLMSPRFRFVVQTPKACDEVKSFN